MDRAKYAALLRDPRWQKKRLEILQRDGWKCRSCEATDRTLHIHHAYYRRNTAPWDYDDWALITLCHHCHEAASSDDPLFNSTEAWQVLRAAFCEIGEWDAGNVYSLAIDIIHAHYAGDCTDLIQSISWAIANEPIRSAIVEGFTKWRSMPSQVRHICEPSPEPVPTLVRLIRGQKP